jgi:hypothetical protein
MKFPFAVKHNGILYEPGKEVPIGKEPVKENADKERTVNEIREELKALGVTKFTSNKKSDLIALLEEKKAEAEAKADEEEEDKDPEGENPEGENPEGEDGEDDLMNKIINEE